MIKNIYQLALIVLIGCLVLTSCQKENLTTADASEFEHFTLKEGRLAFTDKAAYDRVKASLYANQEGIKEWEASLPGFVSLRTQFDHLLEKEKTYLMQNAEHHNYHYAIVQEKDDASMERTIINDVLATMVNKDGFLQIGNTVYRFTYDQFYTTDVANIELLKHQQINSTNSNIVVTPIKRTYMVKDLDQPQRSTLLASCENRDNKLRTLGEIIREDIIDDDCIVRTKHQIKRFGIWWARSTYISVKVVGSFTKIWSFCDPAPSFYVNTTFTNANASSIMYVVSGAHPIFDGCSGSASPVQNGLITTHTANSRTCILDI